MSYPAAAIANYFLQKAWAKSGTMTPMKALKLVYFAHGWHLGLFGTPLIDEEVQAWPYGPVIPSLYHELKRYGNGPITRPAHTICTIGRDKRVMMKPSIAFEDSQTRKLLNRIWEVYGKRFSGLQLSNMTHLPGTPWKGVYDKHGGRIPPDTEIPERAIKEYFASQVDG